MKKIMNNQDGVALLLVMGVIAILSFLLFEFTFETKLNKIKIYNQEDRFQARLNAESGLNYALANLRMYQEGRNLIEKNESIKGAFSSADLENILIQPFMVPIPLSSKAGLIQQNALKEFEKNNIIRGELSVNISKISGLLNPNSLRVVEKPNPNPNQNPNEEKDAAANPGEDGEQGNESSLPAKENKKTNKWEAARTLFVKTVTQMMEDRLKTDEEFHNKHANTSPEQLVNELAFYVNDASKTNGQEFAEAKIKFDQKSISAKHAPMSSIEELYLLPSWDDSIVEMLKDRMSVHELTTIPVNEMTNADLKILFPEINEIQIEEFFKYRDGDVDKKIKPSKFKNADDFKSIVTGKLNIISDSEYQKRMSDLKSAGLVIDTAGKLYKVNSKGTFNNATYTIVAIVDLPVKEEPVTDRPKTPKSTDPDGNPDSKSTNPNNENDGSTAKKEDKQKPVELLLPRVVEIRAE